MKLIVRLVPDQRCAGCSRIGDICERTLLCLYCLGLKLAVERRKKKLSSTLGARFAAKSLAGGIQ